MPTTFSTVATTVPAPSSVPTSDDPPPTTIETTTTLPEVVDAVADAGPDLAVSAGDVVTLAAVEVTEGADDAAVIWRQTSGPDVTAGVGALGGRTSVSFGAPDDVVTLGFELVVSSADRAATGTGSSRRTGHPGLRGRRTDGVRRRRTWRRRCLPVRWRIPFARSARPHESPTAVIVYVRSIGNYAESDTVRLGPGSSVYGGFDADWKRDPLQRARLDGAAVALVIDGDGDRTIGSIELTAAQLGRVADRSASGSSTARRFAIVDSRILSGAGGDGDHRRRCRDQCRRRRRRNRRDPNRTVHGERFGWW